MSIKYQVLFSDILQDHLIITSVSKGKNSGLSAVKSYILDSEEVKKGKNLVAFFRQVIFPVEVMLIHLMRAKIHRATITDADLNYEGSLTVDSSLMETAGLFEYEKVQVVNVNTGSRLETYLIRGEAGKGDIRLNGAAARLGTRGDKVIIIAYADMSPEEASTHRPKTILLNDDNTIKTII